jgi:hypothetical protein
VGGGGSPRRKEEGDWWKGGRVGEGIEEEKKYHFFPLQVKILNNQRDYLSARTRSWIVVGCNITGFVFIILSDIAILSIVITLAVLIFH